MTNPSMPGLVKVGMSARNPAFRAKDNDLTSTGVPAPFEVKYSALFDDMYIAEKLAHQKLSQYHYNKEFFKTDIATAVYVIESVDIPFVRHFYLPEEQKKAESIAARKKHEEERLKKNSQTGVNRNKLPGFSKSNPITLPANTHITYGSHSYQHKQYPGIVVSKQSNKNNCKNEHESHVFSENFYEEIEDNVDLPKKSIMEKVDELCKKFFAR